MAPRAQAEAAYDSFVIPAPGRIFFQAASSIGTVIRPERRTMPLLITGSDRDRLVTPYLSRTAWRIQSRSPARTEYWDFPGRSHFLLNEPGWEDLAAAARLDRRSVIISRLLPALPLTALSCRTDYSYILARKHPIQTDFAP
jgi:alpha-beta hydrolase superfamily lysophospholipase